MPHTAAFFNQRLTFTSHADFPIDVTKDTVGAIDIYLFNSNNIADQQLSGLSELHLHPYEQAIFTKRKQLQAKREYLASRVIIKTYASHRLGYAFDSLHVLFDSQDTCLKVYHHGEVIPLRCCISHSHGQVLVAFTSTENIVTKDILTISPIKLGVDLEWISSKRSLEKIATHYYHKQELQACQAQIKDGVKNKVKSEEIDKAWYRIWTLKEALAKAIKRPIANLLRDNVFDYCQQLQVRSGCYDTSYKNHDAQFDISIISNLILTDNSHGTTNIKILTGKLGQDFRKVK